MFDMLVLQVVVPLGLLAWLALGRAGSRVGWGLEILATGLYVGTVAVAGLWSVLPEFMPWAYIILFLLALRRSARVIADRPDWPATGRGWLGLTVRGALTAGVAAIAMYVADTRRPPTAPVADLAFPLAGGTYYVANGGGRELINSHLLTVEDERFQPWRGQSYGIDLLKVNRWGIRARGLRPSDPDRYLIFGDEVIAPCIGKVVAAEDGLGDLPPPRVDREHLAGNHVILECGDLWVVLAHLRQGSVCVQPGDPVRTGQRLGEVGNSGNSDEPHLHIHAQRRGTADAPLSGAPLVMRFAGRYLVRNDRVDTTK
jgi:hypothetical protein